MASAGCLGKGSVLMMRVLVAWTNRPEVHADAGQAQVSERRRAFLHRRRITPASRTANYKKPAKHPKLNSTTQGLRTRSNVSREMIRPGEGPLARAALEQTLGFRIRDSGDGVVWRDIHLHCKCIERQWVRGSEVEGESGETLDCGEGERPNHARDG